MSGKAHAHQHSQTATRQGAASAMVLVALAALMFRHWQDGTLALYVHPSYAPLVALTAAGLLGVAGVQLWRQLGHLATPAAMGGTPVTWSVAILGVAVLVAALIPARPLGSTAAAAQAGQPGEVPLSALRPLTDETANWTLLEWAQALGGGVRHERLIGRRVSVVGFVYRPREGGRSGEFLVTRFVVRCCAADGFAVSLPVRHQQADSLPVDTWVQVDGVVRNAEPSAGGTVYVDADALTIVPAPATPYLSPT